MADLRLYKDFYRINHTPSSDVYTLVNPNTLSATVVNLTDDSLVEIATVVQESTGVYYAILTPVYYDYANIYEVRWSVVYVSGGPLQILNTRFRFSPSSTFVLGNIISNIEIGVNDTRIIEYNLGAEDLLVDVSDNMEYEINIAQDIDYEIQNSSDITIEISND